jgi:hypothetical protein
MTSRDVIGIMGEIFQNAQFKGDFIRLSDLAEQGQLS